MIAEELSFFVRKGRNRETEIGNENCFDEALTYGSAGNGRRALRLSGRLPRRVIFFVCSFRN